MLKRLMMVLAAATLAGGLTVTGAQAQRGGGHGGGLGGGHIGTMGGGIGGGRIGGASGIHRGGSLGFAPGFRVGRHHGGFRPSYDRAYGYPGYGFGYDYYDYGYDGCEIDTPY